MTAQPSSGSYDFQPATSDLVIDAFSRIQIRPPAFTVDHLFQARMSANLMLAEWSVRPSLPNLWKVELFQMPLIQGVPAYTVPARVVSILDYYVRTFSLTSTTNLSSCYSTTSGSDVITMTWADHGQTTGNWIQVVIQTYLAGILLYGFYQVASTPDANTLTFVAASAATSTVSLSSGTLPVFTTTSSSAAVQVVLPLHGLGVGSQFQVPVSTTVGSIILSGSYTVQSVTDSSTFYFTAPQNAAAAQSVTENSGVAQINWEPANNPPQDRVIFPISRTEYADQPNKAQQAFPTTVWWNRAPATGGTTLNFWSTPDGNGPYTLYYYAMTQIQDVAIANAQTPDVPYRFLEAFAADLAARLSWKFPPSAPAIAAGITIPTLEAKAQHAWDNASGQDTENVPLFITPGMSGYFRG